MSHGPADEMSTRAAGALDAFTPATRAWFEDAFPGGPTPVQARAWQAIGRGANTLLITPTGSGKTLAAFLSAIDRLGREQPRSASPSTSSSGSSSGSPRGAGGPADRRGAGRGVRVLYVSPLKALGADVERNLRRPLAGIAEAAEALGEPAAPISVAVRSGDTPAAQRRRLATRPPQILITTPESLYLMLTSQVRQSLRAVETVIVDEIHSVAGQKRGTHLALSLERLDLLLERPAQRIGLSATVSPRQEVARLLGGARPVTIVADDAPALPEVSVTVPVPDMASLPAAPDSHAAAQRPQPKGRAGGDSRGGGGSSTGRASGAPPSVSSRAWRSDRALRRAMAHSPDGAPAPEAAGTRHSIWPHIEQAILDQVLAHRTTVVFVNSRGLCERLTARLNEAYASRLALPQAPQAGAPPLPHHRDSFNAGDASHTRALPAGAPVIAKAHHGSVSKEQRLAVEDELKSGALRCVVATASLELGIDMGSIDLVLQVAPPPSVASGLQRVGRANHHVGGRPRGTIYPVHRTQLIDAAVISEGMRQGRIERTALVANALDVLAQQTVAAAAMEDLDVEVWYTTVRRSAPYRDLPRRSYEAVLELLAGGYASADLADFAPRLTWDRQAGTLHARPGAQRLAVGASGTIPDRGLFPVVLPEGAEEGGRRRVGELDEEMVNETSVGDVITLGTTAWRVREITGDRVVVDPAPGRSARLPFWHGEGPGRPAAAGAARGAFLRLASSAIADGPGPARLGQGDGARADALAEPAFIERLAEDGLDARARRNLISLLREQRAATGAIPSDTTLMLERGQDESGSWRLILHSPWGRPVHEPWAMAIRERLRTTMGIEPQLVVADDGIVVQLPMTEQEVPGADLVVFDADELTHLVRSRIGGTALFAARFRECAARALLMPAAQPGRRTPLWLQRLKSGQLLEASRRFEGFPISVEAARECLQDVYDLPALAGLMERIAGGAVRVVEAAPHSPSPFAAPLLLGYSSALLYQGDLPHAERSAHLLSLDPEVLAELMGEETAAELLDAGVLEEVGARLQRLAPDRRMRPDAEGVADLLRELGPLSPQEIAERCQDADETRAREALAALEGARRAFSLRIGGRRAWARAEDGPVLREALGAVVPRWAGTRDDGAVIVARADRSPLDELVVRYARTHAVVTAEQVARAFGLGRAVALECLGHLAEQGAVMRLGPVPGREAGGEREAGPGWMVPEVFRRIRARSLARAREAIEPVGAAALQRLVLDRAGLTEPRGGIDGLAEALAALEGVWLPTALWEEAVLPARVADYRPAMLDELLAAGEVVWQARSGRSDGPGGTAREAPPGAAGGTARDEGAVAAPDEIAFFPSDSPLAPVADSAMALGAEAAGLWEEVLAGRATAGSFEPVRRALRPAPAPSARRVRSRRGRGRYAGLASRPLAAAGTSSAAGAGGPSAVEAVVAGGRQWRALVEPEAGQEERALAIIESLLDRYGVISRDIALATGERGGLTPLMPVLRRMEDAGALLRGRFVEGQGPFQLAERGTVEALRSAAPGDGDAGAGPSREDSMVVLDPRDPACLVGRGVAWPEPVLPAGLTQRVVEAEAAPRRRGARVVLAGGRPVLHATERMRALTSFTADRGELLDALVALVAEERRAAQRGDHRGGARRCVVEALNGVAALDRGVSALLAEAGLVRDPRGMRLASGLRERP
ncbi:DEAD/DEAH box helicase [Actinomyces bowdenii]|uniref:DEAD/DEAH box helicase n=1 Tax=Actinomyces bowdenii TaxID=131109 RepID=UPI00214B847E|nr:DEAD/DEAH box helicase [Actinomyces bowdenii]MCR2052463.1 DEAD/DEAH box helicase [Actinomyces bowdenii]